MFRSPLRACLSYFVAMLIAGAPSAAFGQSQEPKPLELAQTLFDKASEEMDQGKYAPACQKLEEATRLVPEKLGVKETLAECYEKTGKLASAWHLYRVVVKKATEQGKTERAKEVSALADALKPRLSTLTLDVPDKVRETPGLKITRNGTPVTSAEWGTPVSLDSGTHEILVTAPGYEPFRTMLAIAVKPTTVVVQVALLQAETSPPRPPSEPRLWQRPLGINVAIVGGGLLPLAAVFGGFESATYGSTSEGLADAAVVTFVAGLLTATAGLILVSTAPPAAGGGSKKVALQLEAAGTGLMLRGAW